MSFVIIWFQPFTQFSSELNTAPEGFHSCHGVKNQPDSPSQFEKDEYVVYNVSQQQIRYLVEFSLPGDVVNAVVHDAIANDGWVFLFMYKIFILFLVG